MRVLRVFLLVFFILLGFVSLSLLAVIRFTPEEQSDQEITVWFKTSKDAVSFFDEMRQDGYEASKGLEQVEVDEPNGYRVIHEAPSEAVAKGIRSGLSQEGLEGLTLDSTKKTIRYKGVYSSRKAASVDAKLIFSKYSVAFEVSQSYKKVSHDAYRVTVSGLRRSEVDDINEIVSRYDTWKTETL